MTFRELLSIVSDQEALAERAAIIQFGSGTEMTQQEAEAETVRQWEAANRPKKQKKLVE